MRSPVIPVFVLAVACSGNSLNVGSDESGDAGEGGTAGTTEPTSGGGTAGTAGTTSAGGIAGNTVDRGGTGSGAAGATGATGGTGAGATGAGGTGVSGTSAGGSANGGSSTGITSCTESFRFLGDWSGNVLDFYFEPVESLRLSVREGGGAGGYVGELTWGSGGAPPPPVTDPDAPYPPGANLGGFAGSAGRGPADEPWPGYPYTVQRGAACDSVLRVSVSTAEIYDEWCSLQEPIGNDTIGWSCMERGVGGSFDGETCFVTDQSGEIIAEYPAWRCGLCGWLGSPVCDCDASGCRYSGTPTDVFELTLIDDGVLSGTDSNCSECTVRLERE